MRVCLPRYRPFRKLVLTTIACLCSSTYAASVDQMSVDDVAYLLFSAPNKIERYDLVQATPLEPIALAQEPSAFTVHGSTAFVAYHRELRAIDLETGDSTFIRNFPESVLDMLVIGEALYVFTPTGYNGTSTALSLADYTVIDEVETNYSGRQFTAGADAFFYRSTGVSPSDIHRRAIAADGSFGESSDSPYHGDYPNAARAWVSPDGSRVIDDAGIAYFSANLNYAGSLGGRIDAMTFVDGNPVIARGAQLFFFSEQLLDAGVHSTQAPANYLASFEQSVYSFSIDDSGYGLEVIDVSGFELPAAGEPLDGDAVAYSPDLLAIDDADVVYAIDVSLLSVFRWSTTQDKHLLSWPLQNPPSWATFSQAHQRLYLGYDNGKITYFDATLADATETHLVTLPSTVMGLADLGSYLFAADPSGAWGSFYTIDIDGNIVSSAEWKNSSSEYVWSEAVGRIFHYRDGISPNDIEWTAIDPVTGMIGLDGDSPYHGDTLLTRYPLRVDPTGQFILTGAGQIVSANSLMVVNSLSSPIADAAWVADQLITLSAEDAQLQLWAEDYELLNQTRINGFALAAIREMNDKLLAIGYENGRTRYRLIALDADGDEDSVQDLLDNCPNVANEAQLDADADGAGDLCDTDADNDGLSNEQETQAQLDPLDPTDAEGDLDGDGYSNRAEALAGSGINDAESIPEPIADYRETFDNGWPTGFFSVQPGAFLSPRGTNQSQALYLPPSAGGATVAFTAVFSAGVLAGDLSTNAPWYEREEFVVYVDGQQVLGQGAESGDWAQFSIAIEPGEHTISFGVQSDAYAQNRYGVILDNLSFESDSDGDGVGDGADNCPTVPNPWQHDDDNDAQGNACDPLPFDPAPPADTDSDGLFDYVDNCPDVANPEQSDIDHDGLGDACDDSDDRPADTDQDGLPDYLDNCPIAANPEQADLDLDGIGDACDEFDDRPIDTDGDGHYDMHDNCPAVSNPDQHDLDGDQIGDACDSDMDGDGIDNSVEDQYAFLDATNDADALMDQDGDGASNLYELKQGNDPQIADAYETLDLADYAIIQEGRAVYSQPLVRLVVDHLYMPETDTYLVSTPERSYEYGVTEQGLEILASGNIFFTAHDNDVVVPASMTEGQVLIVEGVGIAGEYDPWMLIPQSPRSKSIHFIERGSFEFAGQTYPSITLEYRMADSGFTQRKTFAKGLGLVATDGLILTRHSPLLETETETDEDTPASPDQPQTEAPASGGSVDFGWMLAMLVAACGFRIRSKRRC